MLPLDVVREGLSCHKALTANVALVFLGICMAIFVSAQRRYVRK